jgi:hypothetical protein
MRSEPSQGRLRELLEYDESTGVFIWKNPVARRCKRGDLAGNPLPSGYWQIAVDSRHCYAHRLAWIYIHGYLSSEIDHIDGDRANNRICNLRPCTRSQNVANTDLRIDNQSGVRGVSWDNSKKRWRAQIKCGSHRWASRFASKGEAYLAYCREYERLFGEFARLSYPMGKR